MKVNFKSHWGFVVIVVVILIGAIISGIVIARSGPDKPRGSYGTICGTIFDELTEKGIINELAVILNAADIYGYEVCWPDHPDYPGYFEFVDVTPGKYFLSFERSWVKISLTEPDAKWIEGGWICPDSEVFEVKAGETIEMNFTFNFDAYFSATTNIDNLRIRGNYATIFGYGDDSILINDRNLVGKDMTFSVTWENTLASRTDCTINVLDGLYTSDEQQYDQGSQIEVLEIEISPEFLEQCRNGFTWRVVARSLPSIQIQDIMVNINWTVTNPS
jgi:hypothetical protein